MKGVIIEFRFLKKKNNDVEDSSREKKPRVKTRHEMSIFLDELEVFAPKESKGRFGYVVKRVLMPGGEDGYDLRMKWGFIWNRKFTSYRKSRLEMRNFYNRTECKKEKGMKDEMFSTKEVLKEIFCR